MIMNINIIKDTMETKAYLEVLNSYIEKNNMRRSKVREKLLIIFIESGKHFSIEDFYLYIKKDLPEIGISTIYRSFDIFCKAGICKEMHLEGDNTKYEVYLYHEDHDHLICVDCGEFIEIHSEKFTKIQKEIANEYGFQLVRNRLNIYGICEKCQDARVCNIHSG